VTIDLLFGCPFPLPFAHRILFPYFVRTGYSPQRPSPSLSFP
jgi:hypothetical protein